MQLETSKSGSGNQCNRCQIESEENQEETNLEKKADQVEEATKKLDEGFWDQKRREINGEKARILESTNIEPRKIAKFDSEDALIALRWIYDVTGIEPPEFGFWQALRDGYLLCRLLISLHPPFGEKWKPSRIIISNRTTFKARSQITEFITRVKEYGVKSAASMSVSNLYLGTNLSQVLTILGALSKEAEKHK